MAAHIGMMDPAYFVGRGEILSWINSTLGLQIHKVEECASGAVACQLMDACHPGVVPMAKVNFQAKSEYDMIANYKILQATFEKLHIVKHIEVSKLVKARALDNLEFMQWMKAYSASASGDKVYDPVERRTHCKGGGLVAQQGSSKPSSTAPSKPPSAAAPSSKPSSSKPTSSSSAATARPAPSSAKSRSASARQPVAVAADTTTGINTTQQKKEMEALEKQVADLAHKAFTANKERDFYFSKLRDCEILCQLADFKDIPVVKSILKILYSVEDSIDVENLKDEAIQGAAAKVLKDSSNVQSSPINMFSKSPNQIMVPKSPNPLDIFNNVTDQENDYVLM